VVGIKIVRSEEENEESEGGPALPTIFTEMGKLGLELHRQEEVLPVYTVERIDRSAAN